MTGYSDDGFGQFRTSRDKGLSQEWIRLLFPDPRALRSARVTWVPNGPLGNCRLATSAELLNLADLAEKHPGHYLRLLPAFAVGHDPEARPIDMGPLPLPLGLDSPNVLVVGRSGSGKTQAVTLPSALHAIRSGWAMVYVNIKGAKQTRLIRRMARRFSRADDVQLIAPLKLRRTAACTTLEGCQSLSSANEVAEVIVSTAARRGRDGDGAWAYNQSQEFLQHAICAICKDLPRSRRNLVELRQVILSGAFQAFADEHPAFPVLAKFAGYVRSENKNAETVVSAIGECTAFIDEIHEFLGQDEFRCSSFVQDGGLVIIEIDQGDVRRLRPVVTLLLGRLISALQRCAAETGTGSIPHKTLIIIDELMASGPLPGLAEALHTCREQGFSFVAGAQSLSQLCTIYGAESWQSVLDGFQSQIAMGGALDPATAEWFSQRTGIGTMGIPGVYEEEQSRGELVFSNEWKLAPRPVLLPDEIASPNPHPELGMPSTIISGDGKTRPYQAYLTPCHKEGALARMLEEAELQTYDDDLRRKPLKKFGDSHTRVSSSSIGPASEVEMSRRGISNSKGWTAADIDYRLKQVLSNLQPSRASKAARDWWTEFAEANPSSLTLRLAEEIHLRQATLEEWYLASVASESEALPVGLAYLDYLKAKASVETDPKEGRK
ncbi:MAG: type IV secretory system conjugative DNA transfer family protein [Planctomycetota bacterium]